MAYKTYWLAGLLCPLLVSQAAAVESSIATGDTHTLFVDKGAVFAMGSNKWGSVKADTTLKFNTPQLTGVSNVKSVAAHYNRSVALQNDGTVVSWGRAADQDAWNVTPVPRGLITVDTGVSDIALSRTHLFLLKNGEVYSYDYVTAPVKISYPADGVIKSIAAGGGHLLALYTDGTVATYGSNSQGQLGNGTLAPQALLTRVPGVQNAVTIAAGRNNSFVTTSIGDVLAFGGNTSNQLDSTGVNITVPTLIPALNGAKKILGSNLGVTALMPDGRLLTRGFHNLFPSLSARSEWITVTAPIATDLASGVGSQFVFRTTTADEVRGWGMNRDGHLGDGTIVDEQHVVVVGKFQPVPDPEPELVLQAAVEPVQIAAVEPVVDTAIANPLAEAPPAIVMPEQPVVSDTIINAVIDLVVDVVNAVVEVVTTVIDTVVSVVTPEPVVTAKVKCNNGFGNGDQCAPGNSLMHNNAENAQAAKTRVAIKK